MRVWLELTHDDSSCLVLRQEEFDRRSEVQVALPRGKQVVVDSQRLYHGGYQHGTATRYALISTFESSAALEQWIETQRDGLVCFRPCTGQVVPALFPAAVGAARG